MGRRRRVPSGTWVDDIVYWQPESTVEWVMSSGSLTRRLLSSTIDQKIKMARPTQVSLIGHTVGSIPYGRRSIRCNLWHYHNNGLGPHFHGPCKFNVRLPYQGMVSQKGLMCTWWMQTRCLSWAHCLSWVFLPGKFAKNISAKMPRSNF